MIFISYRRKDSADVVGRLHDHLVAVFTKKLVFRDTDRLKGSQDWQADLETELARSEVVLVAIGPTWATVTEDTPNHRFYGRQRLSLSHDVVRRELELALGRSGTEPRRQKVIPILINGATMPSKEQLAGFATDDPAVDLKSVLLTRLADKGAFHLTTGSFETEVLEILAAVANDPATCPTLHGQWLEWQRAQAELSPPGQDSIRKTQAARGQRYLARLIEATKDLNLAGTGLKRRLKLPIEKAYFPLRATPRRGGIETEFREPVAEDGRGRLIPLEQLFAAAPRNRAIVVLGEPGAGKSTAMRRFAWRVATGSLEGFNLPAGIRPVLLELRNLAFEAGRSTATAGGRDAPGWGEVALRDLWRRAIAPELAVDADASPEALLGPGPILWIFDGLDEVFDPKHRALVSAAIQALVKLAPGTERAEDRFLITSRVQGYSEPGVAFGDDFFELQIAPLDFQESCEFIRLWFPSAEEELSHDAGEIEKAQRKACELVRILDERRTDQEKREAAGGPKSNGGLMELIANPLLLNVVCAVYDERENLPANRVGLYQIALDLMLKRKPSERWRYTVETGLRVLQEVAWWLHGQGDGVIGAADDMAKIAAGVLAKRKEPGLDLDGAIFLEYMRQEVGLLARGGGSREGLGFLHRTFQEYLASKSAIAHGRAKDLATRAHEDRWKEVVALSLRDNPEFVARFFRALLSTNLPAEDPWLAGYYLEETDEVPVEVFDEFLGERVAAVASAQTHAMAVLHLAQNAGFATVEKLPVLAKLASDGQGELAALARRLMGVPVETAKVPEVIWVEPIRGGGVGEVGGADHKFGDRREHERTKLSFVWIEPGQFWMGAKDDERSADDRERPAHPVTLTKGFWLGEFPVTNEQYGVFLREVQSAAKPELWDDRRWNQPRQPVVGVDWLQAMAYCRWVSEQLQERCTLPTEAQWEYACRAGNPGCWCFGDEGERLKDYAWFQENSKGSTQPVGMRAANLWGLYDMHGNVWEWCYDVYKKDVYQSRSSGVIDPVEGEKSDEGRDNAPRVLRGGSWIDSAGDCRSAFRIGSRADDTNRDFGFRVALVPGPFVPGKTKGKGP